MLSAAEVEGAFELVDLRRLSAIAAAWHMR
jgi:hypothetical protein